MESVLNTSSQSNYHSCRQSLENEMEGQNSAGGDRGDSYAPIAPVPSGGGDGDSTFICSKDVSSVMTPSSANTSDFGILVQSNVIAESTRTSIHANGSGDETSYEQSQPVTMLSQKLTGGFSHLSQSTPCDTTGGSDVNPALNDCLINSALGCSASIAMDTDGSLPTGTPLRSKQVEQDLMQVEDAADVVEDTAGAEDTAGDEDEPIDENGGAVRQTRSGSFTVVREKAIPGTPIIEDEPVVVIANEERNGSATPPMQRERSPGLMQDSASRPLIPKAKNRRSVWAGDVFSPSTLSNMNKGQESDPTATLDPVDRSVDPFASPLIQPLVETSPNPVSSGTCSRATPSEMLVDTIATSVDAASVPLNGDEPELSYHSVNSNEDGRSSSSSGGNRSYVIHSSENGNNGVTPVIDAGNVNAALDLNDRTPSSFHSSSKNNHDNASPPVIEDGLVGADNGTNLSSMQVGSSVTITKTKATPVRQGSPGVTALPSHMVTPTVNNPPLPPASSSPKPHLMANGSNGTVILSVSPLSANIKTTANDDTRELSTTPITASEDNIAVENGTGSIADDADRSELLARISHLELENKSLKSKFTQFEELNNQLVSSCSDLRNGPSTSDLIEFHKFVQARLQSAEEVSDDYRSLESSFNDLHRRYERSRVIINEAQARDRQLQADLMTMKQVAAIADQRVNSLMREFEAKLADVESRNAALQESLQTEQLKSELRIGQVEIESRNFQQQLQQKDTQIADLNRLLASAMASTARRG